MNGIPLPQSHPHSEHVGSTEAAPVLFLEICRGRTSQPLRPVLSERFLIGSGDACDLQLAGSEIPTLHSLIRLDGRQARLEAVVTPPLPFVNGRPVEEGSLRDGDVIEIGPFGLTVHLPGLAVAGSPPDESVWDDPSACRSVDELSAEQLVDLIEAEQALIDQFESRERLGIEALADAALRRARQTADSERDAGPRNLPRPERRAGGPPTENDADAWTGLERILGELGRLSTDLGARSKRLALHEARQAELARRLVETREDIRQQFKADIVQPAAEGDPLRRAA